MVVLGRAAVVILLLTSCATPYQSSGATGGYRDLRLAPDLFRVSFSGNGLTSPEMAYDYALLRASDLTMANGYAYFAIVKEEEKRTKFSQYVASLELDQTVYYPHADLFVQTYCGRPADVVAFDARFLANELREKYGIESESPADTHTDIRSCG